MLAAYRSESALALAEQPNFDPVAFAHSRDTLYIAAPGERQRQLAPLVVGLLVEIRQARYRAHRQGTADRFALLMALDEARNIAPIHDLPSQLSEGGGQGVQTMVVLQSLSQARAVWREEGHALMDFTDAVVILGGVTDKETCETISRKCGHWDRPIQTISEQRGAFALSTVPPTLSEGWTTHREARLPPDHVAAIEFGQALVIVGTGWEYVATQPYEQHPCFSLARSSLTPDSTPPPHRASSTKDGARRRRLPQEGPRAPPRSSHRVVVGSASEENGGIEGGRGAWAGTLVGIGRHHRPWSARRYRRASGESLTSVIPMTRRGIPAA